MPRYKVGHAYQAFRDGARVGPWEVDSEVELDAELAEWVERDSPGALVAIKDKAKPNRQHTSAKTRDA